MKTMQKIPAEKTFRHFIKMIETDYTEESWSTAASDFRELVKFVSLEEYHTLGKLWSKCYTASETERKKLIKEIHAFRKTFRKEAS